MGETKCPRNRWNRSVRPSSHSVSSPWKSTALTRPSSNPRPKTCTETSSDSRVRSTTWRNVSVNSSTMLEMAERARQINKVGKTGLKRVVLKDDERDSIQERFSGAPAKIVLLSPFERQPDKRTYKEKHTKFIGPTYCFPPKRIEPVREIIWDENTGLPSYKPEPEGAGDAAEAAPPAEEAPPEEVAAAEE